MFPASNILWLPIQVTYSALIIICSLCYGQYVYLYDFRVDEEAYDGDSERKTGESIGMYDTEATTTVEVNKLHYDYNLPDGDNNDDDNTLTVAHYPVLLSQNVRLKVK